MLQEGTGGDELELQTAFGQLRQADVPPSVSRHLVPTAGGLGDFIRIE
jgi:hypothetical protein